MRGLLVHVGGEGECGKFKKLWGAKEEGKDCPFDSQMIDMDFKTGASFQTRAGLCRTGNWYPVMKSSSRNCSNFSVNDS